MYKKIMDSVTWLKPDWGLQNLNSEELELLKQCIDIPSPEIIDNIDEIIRKSDQFAGKFPLETNRLKTLKNKKSIDILKRNIKSTYPLIHERVLLLMAQFIIHKRKYGSDIEKSFYKEMSIEQLIDRLFKKRALNFMTNKDKYMLLDGTKGMGGWELIGTPSQKDPLTLDKCLSYDEVKLSAMLYVSSYTVCINDGTRKNHGVVNDDIEDDAVIIGVIGPRFQRDKMDCEDILITEKNNKKNGNGDFNDSNSKSMWRKLWADFYEIPSYTYEEAKSKMDQQIEKKMKKDQKMYTDRFVIVGKDRKTVFDNEAYYKRISIIADCTLIEAEKRASEAGKQCYLNVIGCGLGVWKMSSHQSDVYVLSFVERLRALLRNSCLQTLTHCNFAYIKISNSLRNSLLTSQESFFLKSDVHPNGGITILFKNREPSSKLEGDLSNKLLVLTYAWDGNAQPGNEYWIGKTGSSGDSAAASATQVSELHNPYVNTAVCGRNTRVIAQGGVHTVQDYCKRYTNK